MISGAGHAALIGWLLLGDIFASEPPPFEAQAVSMVSGAEFEALLAAQQPPQSATEVAQPPATAPEPEPDAPDVAATPDEPIEQPPPLQAETPPPDPLPDVADPPAPADAEVAETPPDLSEPVGEQAVLVPNVAEEAAPEDVDRVAPEPVAQPDPDVTPDPVEQAAVAPDAEGEAVQETPQEATAPEAATTEIVTEATAAPAASLRPPGQRPAAPARQVAATPEPEETPDIADDIAAAVAAAQSTETAAADPAPAAPSGPPLTAGERDTLRVAVSQCWNVGSLSSEALNTTVIVSVSMNPDGTPIAASIALEGRDGGTEAGARQAFEAARRAIIRCGARGYQLPADKYAQWQEIEITFNPDEMRRR